MVRVALYARVSTKDKAQDYRRQINLLYAKARELGWVAVDPVYFDEESAWNDHKYFKRSGLRALLLDAEAGRFDAVLVEDQSRFSRLNPLKAVDDIRHLTEDLKIRYKTVVDNVDSAQEDTFAIMLAVMATQANKYSRLLSSKTASGIWFKRKTASGEWKTPWGRGWVSERLYKPLVKRILELRGGGLSYRDIAAQVSFVDDDGKTRNVSKSFVWNVVRAAERKRKDREKAKEVTAVVDPSVIL